jgi:alkanesulfonate monooxygenase SsuD/methylene tetrahydromethanopterin reductase-like flavin-dependent oxidoreductase (luciferase family)
MRIGIGTPATIPGTSGELVLEWARKADDGPFSSLAIIDRLVYANYEPLITLAACAGATRRIRLLTSVLLAPLRNSALLAKEAASLDSLSGGRLTLGLGVGGRPDDFTAAEVAFDQRGRIFDEQLSLLRRVWKGEPVNDAVGPIGPKPARPDGPELLIGGYAPAAIKRVGKWGDGFISGGVDPGSAKSLYDLALQSWQEERRSGQPRFVVGFYYGLGENAAEHAGQYIRHYYAFLPQVEQMAQAIPTTTQAVKDTIQRFGDVGVDEAIAWPCIANLAQVELLADTLP